MRFIKQFKEIAIKDVSSVGGKNASLGEMIKYLAPKGVNVPDGFALTTKAYWKFLKTNALDKALTEIFKDFNPKSIKSIQETGKRCRAVIAKGIFPKDLEKEILNAYAQLGKKYGENPDVAVRTSGVAEDMPNTSFAGQFETYLNIKGGEELLNAIRKCIASTFTDRAISYREENKIGQLKFALSIGVMKMVRSDLASSGVMFSCDTETGFADVVLINSSYGLGENVVKGKVDPDQYYVFETTLKHGYKPILEKRLGAKSIKLIYNNDSSRPTKDVPVSSEDRQKFVLSDEEILTLARWSILVEEHYKKAMDTEWAKDGRDGKLYLVQARPETVQSRRDVNVLEEYKLQKSKVQGSKFKVLLTGLSVGSKIGQGKVNRIMGAKDINKFKRSEVLVTDMTDPDWVPAMKLASAIITDSGGRTAHAAIVSRELGIPCIVGTGKATKILKTGQEVTVSCAEGEQGKIYQGLIPFKIKRTDISKVKKPAVKIMMNLGEPDQAFGFSFIPNDGVGLAREEFIIANSIKIHPLALINYKKLPAALKRKIDKLTLGYKNKAQFFIDKLAEGIGKIGAAFYPKEVIVRFSDFKTNEYRSLIGGELYEPKEENPMLGWRGASRYYDPKFAPAFILECEAIKKAREEFGLDNVVVMVPFCRTAKEGKKVIKIMEKNGLKPNLKPLKIYVMAEIPSNIILADEFLEIFDGMSIGSNDLAQLILGLDRDSGIVSHVANERNEAVKKMISEIIKKCKEKKKYIGICGQAPSDFPDFAQFLVDEGIESMSLN
ncbi:phosphoenolpyruvate synthase, partial [Candidatus Wolfebacteria bacterium CG03_land_8_20_14_0_80_36_15]